MRRRGTHPGCARPWERRLSRPRLRPDPRWPWRRAPPSCRASPHGHASAWIDHDVDDVDDEVGDEDANDDEQEDPLKQEVVRALDGGEDEVAQARVGEDDL